MSHRQQLTVDAPEPPDEPLKQPRPVEDPTSERPAWTVDTSDRPTAPDGAPTELRVHGVSGSPAEDMLDRPLIRQVAGDAEAGFFRPRSEYGATHGPGGAWLEAYRWGNLTSGAAARAFWLMLLPVTLANVALWLRPPATGMGRRLVHGLCRLFSISLSGTFVLAAIGITMDLFAWQCSAPGAQCAGNHPWLRWAFNGIFAETGRRLALGALGSVVIISVIWWLAVRSWARYESYQLPADRNPDGDGLATPSFWDGRDQVGRLRSLHVAGMFGLLSASLLYILFDHDQNADAYTAVDLGFLTPDSVIRVGQVLFIASLVVIALAMLLVLVPWMVDRVSKSRLASVLAKSLRWVALIITALTLTYACLPRAPWKTDSALPGFAGLVTKLFAGQAVLLALLLLVVLFQRHRCKGAFLGGLGTPVIASLSLGLAAALTAGVSYRVADYLDSTAVRNATELAETERATLSPPVQYQWAAVGFVLVVVVALIAWLTVRFVVRPRLIRRARRDTDQDYPGGRSRDSRRAHQLDTSIATALMTDRLSRVLGLTWTVVAVSGLAAIGFALFGIGPVELVESNKDGANVMSFVVNLGTYLISLAVLGLITLGIQTYRNARVRRTVGIIWDLATFWPRASHPLGPPCYAERVVPELVHRSTWLAKEQNGLVLSGHSQGSVLAAAAILQLPPEARSRTSLMTYGAPLKRLYQRAFPNYFGEQVMQDINDRVSGRWLNLWRRTDPIGGPVGHGDIRLIDPLSFDALPGDRIPPAPQAHGGYQLTPQFDQAMDTLIGPIRVPSQDRRDHGAAVTMSQ